MNLSIGSRVNVPGSDAQGLVMSESATSTYSVLGVMPQRFVSLRYVGQHGAVIDSTFPVKAVEDANPPPVDYASQIAVLRRNIADQNDVLIARDRTIARLQARKAKARKR